MKDIVREDAAVSKIAVLIGIVIVAAVVGGIAYVYQSRGPEASAVIGPEGGVLEVTNFKSPLHGLTINIPAGAVQENITISVKELPKSKVDSILSARKFASAGKHVLGGFVAEPDGLVFNVPINVSVPVEPLNTSGGIPVQARVLLNENVYWLEPTDLIYHPNESMVDMTIRDFSGHAVVELEEVLEENPGGGDCRSGRIMVQSSMEDFSRGGGCQIVFDIVEVTFLDCVPPVTEYASLYETTPECGPESTLTIEVDPPSATLFPCTTKTLKAHVYYNDEEVEYMDLTWFYDPNQDVAEVDQEGVVTGLHEGETQILAVSPFPQFYGECTIKVVGTVCSLEVTPSQATVFIGRSLPLTATARDVDGEKVEGLTANWESSDTGVATVDSNGVVTGVSPGTAKIMAWVEDVGKNVWAEAYVTVKADVTVKEPGSVVLDPAEATICVDQSLHLTVKVYDKDGNELTGYPVEWTIRSTDVIAFDAVTQTVRGVSPGTTEVTATGEGASASATITVVPGGKYRLTWKATVGYCLEYDYVSGIEQESWRWWKRWSQDRVFEGYAVIEECSDNTGNTTYQVTDFWANGHYEQRTVVWEAHNELYNHSLVTWEEKIHDLTDNGKDEIKQKIEDNFQVERYLNGSFMRTPNPTLYFFPWYYPRARYEGLYKVREKLVHYPGPPPYSEYTVYDSPYREYITYFPWDPNLCRGWLTDRPEPEFIEYDETTQTFHLEIEQGALYIDSSCHCSNPDRFTIVYANHSRCASSAEQPACNGFWVIAYWEINVEIIHEEASYSSLQSNNNSTASTTALIGEMGSARNLDHTFITTMILIATTIHLAKRKPKIKPPTPNASLPQLDHELVQSSNTEMNLPKTRLRFKQSRVPFYPLFLEFITEQF